jgi:N-acetylglucosaminyldiphosphoundecaprenol N-acetyl-beta-D-mannosaminyltransferase
VTAFPATEPRTRPAGARRDRARILGCGVDRVDMAQGLARAEALLREDGPSQHMAVNAAKLVLMRRDPALQQLANRCDLVTADGQSVVWASRLLGDPLPERVTGIDLMQELLALAARRGYRVYLLGARPDVLERAAERLLAEHPGLPLVGRRDGYFTRDEEEAVAADIRAARPDMLFVGMPSPRKEHFLERWLPELEVPFAMGVGGSIDVVAGVTRRAPRVLQRLGLEWAYRLAQEPGRMLGRYMTTNTVFMGLMAREIWRHRKDR